MVKQGYKQTEIGILPEDWGVDAIGSITLSVATGGNYKNSTQISPYPLIKMGNISRGHINLNKVEYVIDTVPIEKDKLIYGDVLFNTRNTPELVGKVAIWKNELPLAYFNSNLLRFNFNLEKSNPFFMNLIFNTEKTISEFKNIAKGTTSVAAIYPQDMLKVKIQIPPLCEQDRIAEALSDVDNMISSLEKLIVKKKAVKQGAMQELLTGKKRLPGFNGEWTEKTISQYGNFVSGNGFPLKYQGNPSGLYPFYKVSDFNNVGNGRAMIKANNYVSDEVAVSLSCYIIPKNSIVFAKIGAAIALERKRITTCDCCIDNNMMSFQPHQKEIASYLCYLFQTIRFGELVEATALPSLSGRAIGEIKKLFPPTTEEQKAIASVLSDMDNEIEALEQKLAKTRQLKQGMMQQLLTGKIRLV